MKSKYILMTLAMSLPMNAYSQALSTPSQILTNLEAPAASPVLSVEQRAVKMPALALIPADASICLSAQGISETLKDIMANPMVKSMMGQNGSGLIVGLPIAIKDITLSFGAGADKMIDAALPMVKIGSQLSSSFCLKKNMARIDGIGEIKLPEFDGLFAAMSEFLKADQIAPCLLVVSLEESALPMVKAMIDQWIQNELPKPYFSDEGFTPHKGKYSGLDFQGIKISGKALAVSETFKRALDANVGAQNKAAILAEVVKHEVYVLCAYQGDKLVVSISTDPASQIKVAATPKDSILASGKLAFTDKVAQPRMVLGYGDVAVYASLLKYALADMAGSLKGYEDALKTMNLGDVSGIIASLNAVKADYESIVKLSKVNQPVTALLWGDKGLQVELVTGDDGSLVSGQAVKLTSFADQAGNILFAAGSSSAPYSGKMLSMCENIMSAGWQLIQRVAPMLAQKNPQEASYQQFIQSLSLIEGSMPDLLKLWSACKLAMSGMGDSSVLIMDDKGTMPLIPGIAPEMTEALSKFQIPRVVLASDVVNRQKIATAWDDMTSASEAIIKTTSPPGATIAMTVPQKSELEGITSYCYPAPFFTPKFKPSLSISDKVWVIGSSPSLNISVAKIMERPHTGSLTGKVFAFNFVPVVAMAKANIERLKTMGVNPNEQVVSTVFQVLENVQGIYATGTTDGKTVRYRFSLQMK